MADDLSFNWWSALSLGGFGWIRDVLTVATAFAFVLVHFWIVESRGS